MDEPANSTYEDVATDSATPVPSHNEPRAPWASALSMAEAGLLTDVGIVFDLAWIYVPILGMAFAPLIPTPFVILYLRRGARITVFAACVAGFLMTVLVGPHYGWRLTLEALVGMAMGWAMERHWRPLLTIALGLFINATVAYGAAFGAVYALGLPLQDLYLELRNLLIGAGWLLDAASTLLGVHSAWLGVRPVFAGVAHFTLRYWIPMFYLYVMAIATPIVVLYYSVASTTAFALGHDVRPFPPPWVWRALRVFGMALSPFTWLARMLWRLVTSPLWGPIWLARALASRRRTKRLKGELAALDVEPAQLAGSAEGVASEAHAPCGESTMETATLGGEARDV